MNTAYYPTEIFRFTEECSTAMTHDHCSYATSGISTPNSSMSYALRLILLSAPVKNRIKVQPFAPESVVYSHKCRWKCWKSQGKKNGPTATSGSLVHPDRNDLRPCNEETAPDSPRIFCTKPKLRHRVDDLSGILHRLNYDILQIVRLRLRRCFLPMIDTWSFDDPFLQFSTRVTMNSSPRLCSAKTV